MEKRGRGGEDLNEGGLRMKMRGRDEKGGRGMKKEGGGGYIRLAEVFINYYLLSSFPPPTFN